MAPIKQSIDRMIVSGMDRGAQLYVSIRGNVVADVAVGVDDEGQPLTTSSRLPWYCSAKPFAAAGTMHLVERGRLALEDRAMDHVPEYGCLGKEPVRIEHFLTHTVGIAEPKFRVWDGGPDQFTLEHICAQPLPPEDGPGTRQVYSGTWSYSVMAEIVRRVTGLTLAQYVTRNVIDPMGLIDCGYWSLADEDGEALLPLTFHWMMSGAAHDLGRFYEMLNAGGRVGDTAVLEEASVDRMRFRPLREPHRRRQPVFNLAESTSIMDLGVGLQLESHRYGRRHAVFGAQCSDATFGHDGYLGARAFCDPEHDLVVAITGNGLPPGPKRMLFWWQIVRIVYAELGLRAAAVGACR